MLRSPLLTLFPTWHTALLSWPLPQPSASVPAAPGPGSFCGQTCLGTRSEHSGIPLAGRDASSHTLWNILSPLDNLTTLAVISLLLVLISLRACHPKPGRISAPAFPCCPTQTLSSLITHQLLQTCRGKAFHTPCDFPGIALKSPRGTVTLAKASSSMPSCSSTGMLPTSIPVPGPEGAQEVQGSWDSGCVPQSHLPGA